MAAVEIIFSLPLGYFAGQAAVVIVSGVIDGVMVLAAAGLEAGADLGGQLIDAAFNSQPMLGAPAPHDGGGGWLSWDFTLHMEPADSGRDERFTR